MSRLSAAVLILTGLAAAATADDKLAGKLVVQELQGGFAGFTGKQWSVDADGKWEEADVFNQRVTVKRSGTLEKKELEALAEALKKYEADGLKAEGKEGTNPKKVIVTYGKKTAELTLAADGEVGKPDAKTNQGRFAGVLAALKAAVPAEKK